MIRQERIDPRTCPAWWKFRLFTRLRRYVCIYLAVEAVLTVMTMLRLPWMWNPIAAMVWELVQVGIAGALGWVFGGTKFNYFVESERHMQARGARAPRPPRQPRAHRAPRAPRAPTRAAPRRAAPPSQPVHTPRADSPPHLAAPGRRGSRARSRCRCSPRAI